MQLPAYFLNRPVVEAGPDTIAAFERLYREYVEPGTGKTIDYRLAAPKWQFLCYLGDNKNILLHGSAAPDISEFEPRQSNDTDEFGNRQAVYASSDGIWPLYFAIVDRDRIHLLLNGCFHVIETNGSRSQAYYYFSVDRDALPYYPWRNGMIYLLPGDTFEQQPHQSLQGLTLEVTQWASPVAVKPLTKLAVTPDDFPFLSQMNGHDPKEISKKAVEDPQGFPWRD